MTTDTIGFSADEIDPTLPTRSARLKWAIVVDAELPSGRATNAAVCVASATAARVGGLLGPDATDADGAMHPGLPWIGCTVVAATTEQLAAIATKARTSPDVFVADMPSAGQATRVYAEYLEEVGGSAPDALGLLAVSIVGPRNRIDRLVGRLPLLP
jgi:hypothetical protein